MYSSELMPNGRSNEISFFLTDRTYCNIREKVAKLLRPPWLAEDGFWMLKMRSVAGLLHDIGRFWQRRSKSSSRKSLEMELAKRTKSNPEICNASELHHDENRRWLRWISPIVSGLGDADFRSSARSRREVVDSYIKAFWKEFGRISTCFWMR